MKKKLLFLIIFSISIFILAEFVYAQCSYPSKYDCTTEEGFNIVKQEWQKSECSDDIWPQCVAKWENSKPPCPYPIEVNCDTFEETNFIANKWIIGVCTYEETQKCANAWVSREKCSYPSKIDCSTNEELLTIQTEWAENKCSNDELQSCIDAWGNLPSCSYPSKYDCNTKTELDIIENEYKNQLCSMNVYLECVANYKANQSICSYPSKIDCDSRDELGIVSQEWIDGICTREELGECSQNWMESEKQYCSSEWKCDGNYKYLQNSDCTVSNKEYCSYGCENGVCKPYERRECVNGVAYWYKGNSLYETPENCFVQGKICVEGQCVVDSQCTEHIRTDCYDNDVYWFGDCGNGISDKYMECGEAGCSNGKCATTICTPSWNCGSWPSCTNGKQTRTCTDKNNCGTYSGMPTTTQICAVNYNFDNYPLVLIHGLNLCGLYGGNPVSFSNLKNEFKDYYEDKGTFFSIPNCNQLASSTKPIMLSYGYDTSTECFDYIQDFADRFTTFLSKVQECTNAKKVDVIAHSQGGVISRWAIKYDKAKIDKLIMLGTPNKCLGIFDPKKTGLVSALQLTSQEFYSKLNDGGETCYNTHCYTIGGDTGNGNDGLISTSCVNFNGAERNNIVNCNHGELVNPNECPQAFNYITRALGKSTTSSTQTGNVVKDPTETLQSTTTKTKYCYKRFLGFLWCTEYRYR